MAMMAISSGRKCAMGAPVNISAGIGARSGRNAEIVTNPNISHLEGACTRSALGIRPK